MLTPPAARIHQTKSATVRLTALAGVGLLLVLTYMAFAHSERLAGAVAPAVAVVTLLVAAGGYLIGSLITNRLTRSADLAARDLTEELKKLESEVGAISGLLSRLFATTEEQRAELQHLGVRVTSVGTAVSEHARGNEGRAGEGHGDPLTGLPSRALFRDRLSQALARADRSEQLVALLLVDLDRLRVVNDTLGYDAGDSLLKAVAERMQYCLRRIDTVAAARFEGSTFAVILEGVPRVHDGHTETPWPEATVAKRLLASLAPQFILAGREVFVTASVGIALYPRNGQDETTLVSNANVALRRAKEEGGNTYRYFTTAMNARIEQRFLVESDLRRALERREFTLHYQPQVDAHTGGVVGTEALLRWAHPEHGLILPGEFIPVAEESDLIESLGAWALHQACTQVKAWEAAGLPMLRVSVNVSTRQFRRGTLRHKVADVLKSTGLDAQHLELEITESALMQHKVMAQVLLASLRDLGVRLCIDDFGTGYSSLAYLRDFPIDVVKVDRSFLGQMTTEPSAAAIVSSIISLGHSLGLTVVAEGVETPEQLAMLRAQGCDLIQGYLASPPLPQEALAEILQQGRHLITPTTADL